MSEKDQKVLESMESSVISELKAKLEESVKAQEQLKMELTQSKLETAEIAKTESVLRHKTMQVHEENTLIKSSEEVAALQAMHTYELGLAKTYAVLKKMTAEEAFIVIKAGQEMGLNPMVSMNMLYIVNGTVKAYGDKMLGFILSKGYQVKYEDETAESVKVTIYNDNESYSEVASVKDKIIQVKLNNPKASAIKFAPKNKLRFHAIRMIASFHLPHLFMGMGDEFTSDFKDFEAGQVSTNNKGEVVSDIEHEEIVDNIDLDAGLKAAKTKEELEEFFVEHKSRITKKVTTLSLYGKLLGEFENQNNKEDGDSSEK